MAESRIYRIWHNMKQRCNNKNYKHYKDYWGRWIKYDYKWEKFEWFYEDMWESYKEWLSIDRKNNDWNYCKSNCKWSTNKEQSRNKRSNIIYKWKCLTDLCDELWLNRKVIYNRILRGWSIEKALYVK